VLRLEKLTPPSIQRWLNEANTDGAKARVVTAHCVLRSALTWAMTQRAPTYNAAQLVKVPRPAKKPVTPLSAEQGRKLLEAAARHRLGALVVTSLTMGLRIGEASGLVWSDADAKTLSMRQQVQAIKKGA
jgi:integrase